MSVDRDFTHDAEPVGEDLVVTLVMRARDGDERAWAALVERYAAAAWTSCAINQLSPRRSARKPNRITNVGVSI
jgi:hypothetical protein